MVKIPVKTLATCLSLLVVTGLSALGQPGPLPTPPINPIPGTPGASGSKPRTLPPPAPGSVVNSTDTNTPGILDENRPVTPSRNVPSEELIPEGMMHFEGAPVEQVLDIYAKLVNRAILRGGTLPATPIVFKTPEGMKLTVREAVQALKTAFGMNGITIIDVGDKFVKAVANAEAFQAAEEFNHVKVKDLPELGGYITHVIQLKYVLPSKVQPYLQQFAKIPNAVFPIDDSMVLVLRDFTENVKRMLELIREIDIAIPSDYEQEVIPIKYALASEISSAITSLSTGGGGGGGGTSVGKSTSSRSSFQPSSPGFNRPGSTPGYPGSTSPYGNTPGGYGSTPGMGSTMGSSLGAGSSFSDRLASIVRKVSSSGEFQILGQTKIIADERTNFLLVFASHEDMEMIKKIISKLDVVLPQVLIEAAVVEVSLNNSHDIGVSYLEGKFHGVGSYYNGRGLINNSQLLGDGSFNAASNALGGFNYLAKFGDDLDVTLSAIASDSRAKILQRPRVQVTHAEHATIFVGESRPYPTSSYYGGGAYGGYASIQQLQIGVTLEVQPLVNSDGLVVMDIHQKIESVSGTVNLPNVGDVPITSQKDAVSKVSVRDRDTIIMGGLRENSTSKTLSGVPVLMNVPVLGWLFRHTTDQEVHNELLVMIRPTVLPTPEVAALTAKAEEKQMPGVHTYKSEIEAQDARELKRAQEHEKEMLKHKGDHDPNAPQFSPYPIGP
ncbi:MAG: hypothetical protein C5B50_18550 [Verrucomicrobia bacterium]|nr:MAG: hypothetical protein C5B50_18550 [Verrucomicrobiota bacterium]